MDVLRVALALALLTPAGARGEGSPTSWSILPAGEVGMSVGGGWAVALPFMAYEVDSGLGGDVDLGVRFETVAGLFHFPQAHIRYAPLRAGGWRFGAKMGVAYSFFGLQTEDLNLTSTLYLPFEIGGSGAISDHSDLVLAVGGELDLARFVVLDGAADTRGDVRYDATTLRFGLVSALTADLDVYVMGRVRIPMETVTNGENEFFVIPFLEGGGSWSF